MRRLGGGDVDGVYIILPFIDFKCTLNSNRGGKLQAEPSADISTQFSIYTIAAGNRRRFVCFV